jgi:hypothetical protein
MGEKLEKLFDIMATGGYNLISGPLAPATQPETSPTHSERVAKIVASGGYSIITPQVEPILPARS